LAIEGDKRTMGHGRNKNCYTKKPFFRIKGSFQVKIWTKLFLTALKIAWFYNFRLSWKWLNSWFSLSRL